MKEPKDNGISLNQAVISLLGEEPSPGKRPAKRHVYHDLEQLFGIWNKRESKEFEKHLEVQREVD